MKARRAFTLAEVLMAAFILAILATVSIATVWRLSGFARLKASELAAEAFCSDVAMAYFAQDLETVLAKYPGTNLDREGQEVTVLDVALTRDSGSLYDWMPKFAPKGATENEKIVPFWRDDVNYMRPKLTVAISGAKSEETLVRPDMHVITVKLKWGVANDPNRQHETTFAMSKSAVGWNSSDSSSGGAK